MVSTILSPLTSFNKAIDKIEVSTRNKAEMIKIDEIDGTEVDELFAASPVKTSPVIVSYEPSEIDRLEEVSEDIIFKSVDKAGLKRKKIMNNLKIRDNILFSLSQTDIEM
ncbi:MAG: hypothetical protein BWY64_01629 [bacterium ADurb.Bin363]|nr:MAG: hypothetical protein BWY64_01629 [bacterium ADurb.Bin363]